MDDIFPTVIAILKRESGLPLEPTAITRETPLFDGGFDLDSLALLESILSIEAFAGVRLREEDITHESLATVGDLIHQVQRRRRPAVSPP